MMLQLNHLHNESGPPEHNARLKSGARGIYVPVPGFTYSSDVEDPYAERPSWGRYSSYGSIGLGNTIYYVDEDFAVPFNRYVFGGHEIPHRGAVIKTKPMGGRYVEYTMSGISKDAPAQCNAFLRDTQYHRENITGSLMRKMIDRDYNFHPLKIN